MVRESLTSATRGHVMAMPHWSDEETDNPLRADDRNFYKVEKLVSCSQKQSNTGRGQTNDTTAEASVGAVATELAGRALDSPYLEFSRTLFASPARAFRHR